MATGLQAHGDDRVATAPLQPDGFGHGGRRGNYLRPGRLDPRQQLRLRQAEVEADHFRTQFLDQRAQVGIERRTVGWRIRRIEVRAEFFVIGLQPRAPARLAFGIGLRRLVAEEIHVQWLAARRAESRHLDANLFGVEQRARQRTQPAGLGHRDRQRRTVGPGHRRLDDWQLDAKQVADSGVGPCAHRFPPAGQKRGAGRPLAAYRIDDNAGEVHCGANLLAASRRLALNAVKPNDGNVGLRNLSTNLRARPAQACGVSPSTISKRACWPLPSASGRKSACSASRARGSSTRVKM
ncbi:hypothetical protein D3C76_398560 [compost metagenome]